MLPRELFCFVLALQFSTNTSAEDVTVSVGDTAFLPCPTLFNNSETFNRTNVQWIKDGVKETKLCTYSIERNKTNTPKCKPRFNVNTEPLGLNITDVESSDAGLYTCSIIKTIPPPVVEKTSNMTLKVNVPPSLTLQLMNSTDLSCVELLCSLQGLRAEHVNFKWTRASRLLQDQETVSMNSTLVLCKPNWTEGETLTCQAIYSHQHIHYSANITLPCNSASCKLEEASWLIIAVISACAGLLLLVLLGVAAICKCKKRNAENGPVLYRNKIYGNIIFSTATNSSTPSTTRSIPHTITQTQTEECIYEN